MAKKILLISDTHSYIDEPMLAHAAACDEVWHGGDWGDVRVHEKLTEVSKVRGVYGNIDDLNIRTLCPEFLTFEIEGIRVLMTHIAGRPPGYNNKVLERIKVEKPRLFICGHSHICAILPDRVNDLLFINPGAAGTHGFHKVRTMVRLTINAGKIENAEVIEMKR